MKKTKTITIEQLAREHGEPSADVKAILANYRSNVEFKFRKGLVIDVLKTHGEDAAYAVADYVGLECISVQVGFGSCIISHNPSHRGFTATWEAHDHSCRHDARAGTAAC